MANIVSIVMPTYNCGDYIEKAIDSVLAQTFTDWELLIVDDCSVDNTQDVVDRYRRMYPHIQYIRFKKNSGPATARTVAIGQARGKYVAFLDADDIWDRDKLGKQLSFMEREKADFSCTAYRKIDVNGKDLGTILIPPEKVSYQKCIRLSNPIGNLTAMYNQEKLGKFVVPDIRKRNDFALWLQVLKKTDYCYGLSEVLASYRVGRKESISRNKIAQVRYHWQLYHDIEEHNVLRSLYEIGCWAFVKGTGFGINKKTVHQK